MTTGWSAPGPDRAGTVGRMLYDFNTELESATPGADALSQRFAVLLEDPDVIVLLAERAAEPTGFAFLTLRPTPYGDGPLA